MIALLAFVVAAATPATAAVPTGPSLAEFTALRVAKGESCPPIRKLTCGVLGDPTEYKCSWQERFSGKPWTTSVALIARNGSTWEWLDGGPRCSSLPQR